MWSADERETVGCQYRSEEPSGRSDYTDSGVYACWYNPFGLCMQGKFKIGSGRCCWCAGGFKKGKVLAEPYIDNFWCTNISLYSGFGCESGTKRKLLSPANLDQSCIKTLTFHNASDCTRWYCGMCASVLFQSNRNWMDAQVSISCTDGIEVSRMRHASWNTFFIASEICRCLENESIFAYRLAVGRCSFGDAEVE